jgi:hypothetical protein
MPMNVDVQAVVSNLPTLAPEAARGPSVGSNTAISPLPVIDAAEKAKIANALGLAAFESLWDGIYGRGVNICGSPPGAVHSLRLLHNLLISGGSRVRSSPPVALRS